MFQQTVATIAIIILILSLCFIGIALYRQKYNSDYPPVIPNCPDYWDMSGNICINTKSLGNDNDGCRGEVDFSGARWAGQSGLCGKHEWAKSCNLTWDGISDNPELCS